MNQANARMLAGALRACFQVLADEHLGKCVASPIIKARLGAYRRYSEALGRTEADRIYRETLMDWRRTKGRCPICNQPAPPCTCGTTRPVTTFVITDVPEGNSA